MREPRSKLHRRRAGAPLAVVASALWSLLVGAHSHATADVAADALEEITVTATKRPENLQDVPVSIAVYTATDIQNFGFKTIGDIGYVVPNMTWAQLTTISQTICIRGVCSDSSAAGFDTSIAVILDDVYIGRASGFASNLLDVDRIEVLRGPQGTLQGRNVTGGSIDIVSSRPSDQPSAVADVSYGNFDEVHVRALFTGPIVSDILTGKLAVSRGDHEGYAENIDVGKPLDTENSLGVRGQLRFTPTTGFEMLLTGDYEHYDDHDMHNAFGPPDVTEPPAEFYTRQVGGAFQNYGDREVFGGALNVYWTLPNQLKLASISSYRGYRVVDVQTATPYDNFTPSGAGTLLGSAAEDQRQRQFTQEIRLSSPDSGALTWIGGLYYFWEDLHDYSNFLFGENIGTVVAGNASISDATTWTNSFAAFGSATWSPNSFWSVRGGVRETRNARHISVTETAGMDGIGAEGPYVNLPTPRNPVPTAFADALVYPTNHESIFENEWTGDLSVAQHWREGLSTYLKYAHGFKGGGFNANFNSGQAGQTVNPEFVDEFEAGLRSELFDGRTRLNATWFYLKDRDQQVVVFDPSTFFYVTSNAPRTKSYGAELDLSNRIGSYLTTSLGVGLTDAHFEAGEWSGNQVPGTSQVNFTATLRYLHPIPGGLEFYGFTDPSWHDGYYTQPDNEPVSHQKSYWWIDGRAGVQAPDARWSAGLYVHNALNTNLLVSGQNETGLFTVGFIGPPRTYGVETRVKF